MITYTEILQIKRSHQSARPTLQNPAWWNTHHDLDKALNYIYQLQDLLNSAMAIANRKGEDTAWIRFQDRLVDVGISGITARTFKRLPSDDEDNVNDSNQTKN